MMVDDESSRWNVIVEIEIIFEHFGHPYSNDGAPNTPLLTRLLRLDPSTTLQRV